MKIVYLEAVVWRCSVENVFLEISQNSQENTCTRASKFVRTPYFNRTLPVGASIYLAIIFSVVCFIAVYTVGKLQVKYFALIDFAAAAITYFFLRLWSLTKDFFTIERTAGSWKLTEFLTRNANSVTLFNFCKSPN